MGCLVASPLRAVLFAIFILVVFLALPDWLNSYFLLAMTGVVIYSIVTLGLGLLIGRVGMVSLCQFVLAGLGVGRAAPQLRHGPAVPRAHPVRGASSPWSSAP